MPQEFQWSGIEWGGPGGAFINEMAFVLDFERLGYKPPELGRRRNNTSR